VKRGLTIQFVLLLLAMLLLAGLHCGYQYLTARYEAAISAQPIVLFSPDLDALDALLAKLENKPYINSYSLASNIDIAQALINAYDLMPTAELLQSCSLPHMLTLRITAGAFTATTHDELMALIKFEGPIEVEFREELYRHYRRRLDLLTRLYGIIPWAWCGIIAVVTLFLRVHFMRRARDFWKVYHAAGGHRSAKVRSWWIDTLWLSATPAAVVWLLYCGAHYFYSFNCQLSPLTLLWGAAAALLGALLAALTGRIQHL
jgi:hypothetical protein